MAESTKHAALKAKIAALRQLQLEDLNNATYLGWRPESVAAHERRTHQIAELERQLASLDETAF